MADSDWPHVTQPSNADEALDQAYRLSDIRKDLEQAYSESGATPESFDC
jgi:hypothetical protein